MASRVQLESQCGRSDVPARTATETPSGRASPRPPSNRLDAHGTRPLPDINPDRYRRAVWDDTNPDTIRRCCRACRAAPGIGGVTADFCGPIQRWPRLGSVVWLAFE